MFQQTSIRVETPLQKARKDEVSDDQGAFFHTSVGLSTVTLMEWGLRPA